MHPTDFNPPARPFLSKERLAVFIFCGLAALRVFIYSAAFPFFNNVDEEQHFDRVVKFSHGELPHGLEHFSEESMRYIAAYGSPEFLMNPEQFPEGRFPTPSWKRPFEEVRARLAAQMVRGMSSTNAESSEPPLYYAMAGAWLKAGRWFGQEEVFLLYWIRFLNVIFVSALVWMGYVAARMVFPEQLFPRLAVPMLLAFIPQDTFYSIQNDVLSPICFGGVFICVLFWFRTESPGVRLAVVTALSFVATSLVKNTNVPLMMIAGCALLLNLWRLKNTGQLRRSLPALAWLFFLTAIPISAWLLWNLHTFGDFTGSATKARLLGWTHKPVSDWWSHPIFTPAGLWTFGLKLMATFWRGEFCWSLHQFASPAADLFYWISSVLFLGASLFDLTVRRGATGLQRYALAFGILCFVAGVAFLALLSISFDFGNCFYPSRDYPYFTSGRLISGAEIPFLLLYAYGLNRILGRFASDRLKFIALAAVILLVTISEIIVNAPAFASEYNWFHL